MKHVIPGDWDGETFCRYSICWPDSPLWRILLRGLVTEPARGFFWDERTGSIRGVLADFRQTMDYNIELWEVIMACGDTGLQEIAQALTQIAIALNAQATATITTSGGCCDERGSGGTGQSQPPFNPIEEGNPSSDPPPEGYETWEEFFSDKCAIATDIVKTLEGDLGDTALFVFQSMSLPGLIALLTITLGTPIPVDDIVAIATLLLAITAEIVVTTALSIVNNHEQELICELFNGHSSASSRDMFLSAFNGFVDTGVAEPVEAFAIKTLMSYMVGSSVTNRLYTKDLTRIWTGGDCSGCYSPDLELAAYPDDQELPVIIEGQLIFNEWITLESGLGYFASEPAWQMQSIVIRTKDQVDRQWECQYLSGGGPQFQLNYYHPEGGIISWTADPQIFTFSSLPDPSRTLHFQSADAGNHANPPSSKFRIRIKCLQP